MNWLDFIFERIEHDLADVTLTGEQVKLLIRAARWEGELSELVNRNIELVSNHGSLPTWKSPHFTVYVVTEPSELGRGHCNLKLKVHVYIPEARGYILAQTGWNVAGSDEHRVPAVMSYSAYEPVEHIFTAHFDNLSYGVYSVRHGFRAEKCLELQAA